MKSIAYDVSWERKKIPRVYKNNGKMVQRCLGDHM